MSGAEPRDERGAEPRDERGAEPRDERGAEARDHLQRAAIELIAAARALLDIAEEAVREPQGLLDLLATTGKAAAQLAASAAAQAVERAERGERADSSAAPSASPPGGGVEHIRIS